MQYASSQPSGKSRVFMANRNFANGGKIFQMHARPVMVDLQVTIGASGAVSSFTCGSAGATSMVASVAKSATGTYLITLADPYLTLLGVIPMATQVASSVSGISSIEQLGAMATTSSSAAVTIQTLDAAGAVANPASGAVLKVAMFFNDSSAV